MNPPPPRAAADALDSSRKALLRLIPLSLAYFGGHVSGAIWTYVLLVLTGHAPTWFGPELRDWSGLFWSEAALKVIGELDNDARFAKHPYKSSSRNYVQVGEPDSPRRVRRVMYFSRSLMVLKGVVRFGSDCEGPPRHVHGGCTAAFADQVMGTFVVRSRLHMYLTGSLTVNYKEVVPLGSQLGFDVTLDESFESDWKKTKVVFKMFSLDDPERVFATASAVFVNAAYATPLRSFM